MVDISKLVSANATETRVNDRTVIYKLEGADERAFEQCSKALREDGCEKKEAYIRNGHFYGAYLKDNTEIFVNYFKGTGEMTVACEKGGNYFSYSDTVASGNTAPQITQIHLEDFGMSYAIRLSDGRFILIDGGRGFEPDVERLYECIKNGSPYEKPIVAAWILTHPHSDHFHAFMRFMEKYSDSVTVEKFIFNFPEADDLEHYPKLASDDYRFEENVSGAVNIPYMLDVMKKTGAPMYTARTGQTYKIGDAVCEILTSMDDTIGFSDNVNASSLVIRMELGGQVTLWATDTSCSTTRLPQRYGEYLKADILQVPHHGFESGTAEAEIAAYELIRPKVCFLPVSEYNGYKFFCNFKEGTRHLFANMDVEEMILGDCTRTVTLPYTAPAYKKAELKKKYCEGIECNGATAWIYSNLSTACREDFEFTVVNTTNAYVTLWIQLLFEDKNLEVRDIKTVIPYNRITKLNIVGDKVDGDALYFNWLSLKEKGVPENAEFAVRFLCDIPLVISHKKHTASYHSSVYR